MDQTPKADVEDVLWNEPYSKITPLESVVGFKVAEETYDLLSLREQLILDMLCAGWTHAQIGIVFEVSQPSISSSVRRMRFKLAGSMLYTVLDARNAYKRNEL